MRDAPVRLTSLDAFRGFTIAAMVLVNNPGDWGNLHAQLAHAKWNGWTFTDCIFPFFLFIGGVAMTLSLGRLAEAGADQPRLLLRRLVGIDECFQEFLHARFQHRLRSGLDGLVGPGRNVSGCNNQR